LIDSIVAVLAVTLLAEPEWNPIMMGDNPIVSQRRQHVLDPSSLSWVRWVGLLGMIGTEGEGPGG
jgi:hypothetical protein